MNVLKTSTPSGRARSRFFARASCGALLALIASSVSTNQALAVNVTVTPTSLNNWVPTLSAPGGDASFVPGPASPPLGVGSFHVFTGTDGSAAAAIRNTGYSGTPLADITALSYWEYATAWNGQQVPYITLNVDSDNNGSADDLLFFEPAYQNPVDGNPGLPNQGVPVLNAWQDWDALSGGWYSFTYAGPGTGVGSWGGYLAANPNAVLLNTPSGAVRLVSGFASPGDVFDGNVDAFTIGINGVDTTFDFEPVPEPSTLVLLGLGLSATIGCGLRRKGRHSA